MSGHSASPLRSALLGAAIGALVLSGIHAIRPGLRVEFDEDHPLPARTSLGFGPESRIDGVTARSTSSRGDLRLRGIDRRVPWTVLARVRAPSGRPIRLLIEADGRPFHQVAVGQAWTDVVAIVPRHADRWRLILSLHSLTPDGDEANRGVLVDYVELRPASPALPPMWATLCALVAGSVVGAGLALTGASMAVLSVVLLVLSVAQSVPLLRGLGPFSDMPRVDSAVLALMAAAVAIGAGIARLARMELSAHARVALLLTIVAVHLKLLVFLHPGVTYGDTGFHVNRLLGTAGGNWLFTSLGPGGEFPYPVALYVTALPLLGWVPDAGLLLRTLVAVVNGVAGLSLYLAAARAWSPRAGLSAVALFHLLPQNLQIQAVAFLTNAFGNDLAVMALAAISLALGEPRVGSGRRRKLAYFLVAAMAGTGAALSHVSSGVILVAALGLLAPLWLVRGREEALGAVAVVAVVATVTALAWGLYYQHFVPTYRALATQPAATVPPAGTPPPIMRAEAHQTQWVPGGAARLARAGAVPHYLQRYYGLVGLALGLAGLLLAARRWRTDSLAATTLAWAGALVGFLVLGVLSPIDLRYYLAGYPLIALAGGLALATGVARGGLTRFIATAAAGWLLVEGAANWWTWLGTPDI